jgi:beta-lactamase class A
VILLVLGLLSCLVVAASFLWYQDERTDKTAALTAVDRPAMATPLRLPVNPDRVRAVEELDSKLPSISEAHPGTHGIVVFDPNSGKTASINADQRFVAASLSKLYALLTLYRAAAKGELSLDDEITMHSSDVWAEGTGVLHRYPVGYTMTLRECADFLIKESDNTADYWMPNTTTPNDILLVLRAISDPSYTSPKLSAEMLDIMTNTSFEERLPQPLPEGTRVAHKIGSYESTFSDAGIVFPEGPGGGTDQRYYVVVFSDGATEAEARGTIHDVSLAAYRALAPSDAR